MRREALEETRDAITGGILECLRLNRRDAEADALLQAIYERERMGCGPMSIIRFSLAYAHQITILRPGYDLTAQAAKETA